MVQNIELIYIICVLCAYLIGSISPSLIISTAKKKNIREHGTGNLGASNTAILLGIKWGVVVGLCDILKGLISVLVVRILFPEEMVFHYVVGAACVLGHIFPFYLKFKGGKGLATFFGIMLGLSWPAFIIIGLVFLTVSFVSDYIVVGTVSAITLFPIYTYVVKKDIICVCILVVLWAVIGFKHRKNYINIYHKTEVGIKEAISGKHKI